MRVTLYKSTDGQLHETYEAFAAREQALKVEAAMSAVEHKLNFATFGEDDLGNRVIYADNIAAFVFSNADLLREVLNDAVIVKRGRKPGGEGKAAAQAA